MNIIHKKTTPRINAIKKIMGSVPHIIAGGYPRDLYFGIEPKDVDVWIKYSRSNVDFVNTQLRKMGIVVKGGDYSAYEFARTSTQIKISGILQPVGIDLIFVSSPLDKVISQFDYNINQFQYDDGTIMYKGDMPLSNLSEVYPTEIHRITPTRKEKMKKKFAQISTKTKIA